MIKKLLSISSLYVVSNMLQSAVKLILLAVYVRYLTVEQYGILGIVNTFAALFSIFAYLGIDKSVSREYFDYYIDSYKIKKYLFNIMFFLLALDLFMVILAFIIGPKLYYIFLQDKKIPYYPYIPLALVIAIITSFYGIAMTLLQVQQKAVKYVSAQILKIILVTAISLFLVIKMRYGAMGIILGDLTSTLLLDIILFFVFLWSFYTANKADLMLRFKSISAALKRFVQLFGDIRIIFDSKIIKQALAFGVPLIILDLGNWLLAGTGRLFLVKYGTLAEVGIYTFADTIAFGLNMVMSAFYAAYYPFFFKTAQENKEAPKIFACIADLYVLAIGGACLAGMLFSKEITYVLAPATYKSASEVLKILFMPMFMVGLYLMITLPLLYLKKTKLLPIFLVVAGMINISVNLILTPSLGVIGTAWAKTIAQGCMLAVAYLITSKRYPIKYNLFSFWALIILVMAGGMAFSSFQLIPKVCLYLGIVLLMSYVNYKRWVLVNKTIMLS